MKKSRQAKAREFSAKERKAVHERDERQCIFCRMDYHMEKATPYGLYVKGIMHYIPRSRNGLGIARNGAVGCQYHHEMLDNGNRGRREEMLELFRSYLKSHYTDWDEEGLVYRKWQGNMDDFREVT